MSGCPSASPRASNRASAFRFIGLALAVAALTAPAARAQSPDPNPVEPEAAVQRAARRAEEAAEAAREAAGAAQEAADAARRAAEAPRAPEPPPATEAPPSQATSEPSMAEVVLRAAEAARVAAEAAREAAITAREAAAQRSGPPPATPPAVVSGADEAAEEARDAAGRADDAAREAREAVRDARAAARELKRKENERWTRQAFTVGLSAFYAPEDIDDGDVIVKSSPGVSAHLGYRVHPFVGLELRGDWLDGFDLSSNDIDGEIDVWAVSANLKLYVFPRRIQPYVVIGFGALNADRDAKDDRTGQSFNRNRTDVMGRFGAGVEMFLSEWVVAGIEASYNGGGGDVDEIDYGLLQAGLQLRF